MSFNEQIMRSLRGKIKDLEERFSEPPAPCEHDACFCQTSHYKDLALAAEAIGTSASTMLPDIEAAEFIEWAEDFDRMCEGKAMPILQAVVKRLLEEGIKNLGAPVVPLIPSVGEA